MVPRCALFSPVAQIAQYHRGFREQVEKWPVHPLDLIIDWLGKYPKARVADFGCGEARLAATVPNKVCDDEAILVSCASSIASLKRPWSDASLCKYSAMPFASVFFMSLRLWDTVCLFRPQVVCHLRRPVPPPWTTCRVIPYRTFA